MSTGIDSFDPARPLGYTKLGGDPASPTPTQYSWLTTIILRLYHYSPIRPIIQWLYKILSKTYITTFSFLTHQIYRLFTLLPQSLFTTPHQFYRNTLKPILVRFLTYPSYFARTHPNTITFFFAILFSYLVLFDYETDLLHTPYWPINDPTSALGLAIQTGRKIRRALGQRSFYQYQQDKAALGELVPTKQAFVNHYGPFVDEVEWNHHHNYRDAEITLAFNVLAPNTLDPLEVETQSGIRYHRAEALLEDELFRQRELFAQKRIEVMDKLYNQTQWDLRDGSIVPPGFEPDPGYKPYKVVPENPNNPISHNIPGSGSLGATTFEERRDYWSPWMKIGNRQVNFGEFDINLDLKTSHFIPEELPDKPNEPDQFTYPGVDRSDANPTPLAVGEIEPLINPDGSMKKYEDLEHLPPNPIPRQRAPGLDRWEYGGDRRGY